jgi:hypothetical protein
MYDAARKKKDKEQIPRGKMDGAGYSPRSNRSNKV